jgi:hypothetical protein
MRAIGDILRGNPAIGRLLDPFDRQHTVLIGDAPMLILESIHSEDWASATFVGQRHWLDLRIAGYAQTVAQAGRQLHALLGEMEIAVQGHIVAEVVVTSVSTLIDNAGQTELSLRIEALTIAD